MFRRAAFHLRHHIILIHPNIRDQSTHSLHTDRIRHLTPDRRDVTIQDVESRQHHPSNVHRRSAVIFRLQASSYRYDRSAMQKLSTFNLLSL